MHARGILGCALAALALLAPGAHAQRALPDSASRYLLATPPSEFEWGCFGGCACPPPARAPLSGTFTLVWRTGPGPVSATTTWDVLDLRWVASDGATTTTIRGAGTYVRAGGGAPMERLTLDLSFDGGPPLHFDSGAHGATATFPEIRARLSLHGEHCRDSVLVVDARPLRASGLRAWRAGAPLRRQPAIR